MKHLTDEGLKVLQPQGPGLADCLGLPLRLMDGGRASTDSPMPGAPLLARGFAPSRSSPQGGGGRAASGVLFRCAGAGADLGSGRFSPS